MVQFFRPEREEDAYRPVWYDDSFLPDNFLNEESESVETDEEMIMMKIILKMFRKLNGVTLLKK